MDSICSMVLLSRIVHNGLLMEINKMQIQTTKVQKISTKKF